MTEDDWKDRFAEIAGWLEYDCGLPRKQAEYQAARNISVERAAWRKREIAERASGV
jgi:hypothetical protein